MVMLSLLAVLGFAAHARITHDAAIASSLILQVHFPSLPVALHANLAWFALIVSLIFSLAAAWQSHRFEKGAGLIAMMITGILCWASTQTFSGGYIPAAWGALSGLIGSAVLAAWVSHQLLKLHRQPVTAH